MIPIYLISLKKDEQRKKECASRFPAHYPLFNIVEAVNGNEVRAQDFHRAVTQYYNKHNQIMTPSEYGCSMSHIRALEEFLATDQKAALILEDDIIGSDDSLDKINIIAEHIIKSGNEPLILMCGGLDLLATKKYIAASIYQHTNIAGKTEAIYRITPLSLRFLRFACCYLVTRQSAKSIIHRQKNNYLLIADMWQDLLKNSKTDVIYVNKFSHPYDLSTSNIQSSRVHARKMYRKKHFISHNIGKIKEKTIRLICKIQIKLNLYFSIP